MIRRPPRSPLFPYRRSSDLASTGLNLDSPLAEFLLRIKAQVLAEFGENHRAGMDQEEANPVRVELRVRFHRSEEHTSELQSHVNLVCRLLLEKKNTPQNQRY